MFLKKPKGKKILVRTRGGLSSVRVIDKSSEESSAYKFFKKIFDKKK